jgi:hypothetical protein
MFLPLTVGLLLYIRAPKYRHTFPHRIFFREMHTMVYRPLANNGSEYPNYPLGGESQRRTPQSPNFAVVALGISIASCLDGYAQGKEAAASLRHGGAACCFHANKIGVRLLLPRFQQSYKRRRLLGLKRECRLSPLRASTAHCRDGEPMRIRFHERFYSQRCS